MHCAVASFVRHQSRCSNHKAWVLEAFLQNWDLLSLNHCWPLAPLARRRCSLRVLGLATPPWRQAAARLAALAAIGALATSPTSTCGRNDAGKRRTSCEHHAANASEHIYHDRTIIELRIMERISNGSIDDNTYTT